METMDTMEVKIIQSQAVVVKSKEECLQEKEAIIKEMRAIDPATPSLGRTVSLLRDKFYGCGSCGKEDNDRLKGEFNTLADQLFEKRTALWQENLRLYENIVSQAESLAESTDYKDAKAQMKSLREQWGKITHTVKEDEDRLWKSFKAAEDKLYANAKLDYEDRLSKQGDGKLIKEDLVRQAEVLAESTDLKTAKDQMKALQEQWKQSPHASKEDEDILWPKFRKAADTLFEKVNQEYEERKKKQDEAKTIKEDLVSQAEKLSTSTDFKNAKEQMKALQEQWKQSPRASREDEDALWNRFRTAADRLFENSKKAYENRHVLEQRAKTKKEKIISKIEAMAILANTPNAVEEIKRLSDEFYEAGSAGKENNEMLKEQLKAAKDHFFSIRRGFSEDRRKD